MIEMSNQDRWGSSSSSAKRPATENGAKLALVPSSHQAKRRVPLSCLTNQANVATNSARPLVNQNGLSGSPASSLKKGTAHVQDTNLIQNSSKDASLPSKDDQPSSLLSLLAPCSTRISPCISDGDSVSLDETMSTCDSFKSPDFEYIYNGDSSVVASLERKAFHDLFISKQSDGATENVWKGDFLIQMQTDEGLVINVDGNHKDTQLCAEYACDIYNHLRIAEMKKRPAIDFMERVQKDITASMRALLIDWLVEVAEEYRLMPDTLYLTVNYIDRYLSGNVMNRQRLQLLGVACMLISAKYEEICAPQVEEFCYITDNTYFRDEVLEMESAVLKYLKFELTVPTVKCFLRRFIRATQGCSEVPLHLEFLANYIAELSLLEYDLLGYSSSLIAASAVFLAKFISLPTERPWNTTLRHYTQYRPSELRHCVKVLQSLFCNSHNSNLPALREKYSQQKYKSVSLKFCPQTIPSEFFEDLNC